MREYGITLLTVYRNLPKMAAAIERAADRHAIGSFHPGRRSTLEQIEELCALIAEKEFYRNLRTKLQEIIYSLSEEHRLLLEYKYFRKKGEGRYDSLRPQTRTYFRKQNRAYDAFMVQLLSHGMSQKWFNDNALPCDWLREQHRRVMLSCMRLKQAAELRKKTCDGKGKEGEEKAGHS